MSRDSGDWLSVFRSHNRRSKARRSSYANQLSAIEVPYRPDALAAGVKTIPLESPVTLLDAPALYGLRRSASGEPMMTSASTLATVHASREMVPPDPGGDYQSLARIAYVRRSRLSSEHIYDTVSGDGLSIGRLSVDNYWPTNRTTVRRQLLTDRWPDRTRPHVAGYTRTHMRTYVTRTHTRTQRSSYASSYTMNRQTLTARKNKWYIQDLQVCTGLY